jgi:hypothetical protein
MQIVLTFAGVIVVYLKRNYSIKCKKTAKHSKIDGK